MAMTAGTVNVAADGTVTKSGMAEALYDQLIALPGLLTPPQMVPSGAAGVPMKKAQGLLAEALARGLVGYLTVNAKARIVAGRGGLQKTPDPNNPNTDCLGPGDGQDLPIV